MESIWDGWKAELEELCGLLEIIVSDSYATHLVNITLLKYVSLLMAGIQDGS